MLSKSPFLRERGVAENKLIQRHEQEGPEELEAPADLCSASEFSHKSENEEVN